VSTRGRARPALVSAALNARLFWKALVVQAIVVAIPFAILGLAFSEDFFEDWGWLSGPVVWLGCSVITGRLLKLPTAYVLFSAVAGGVAGLLVMLATTHLAGIIAGLLVFAASCGSYDPKLAEPAGEQPAATE
jgi:hypothetical protein